VTRHWLRDSAEAEAVAKAKQHRRAYVVAPSAIGRQPWAVATIGEYTRFESLLPAVSYVDARGEVFHGIPPRQPVHSER
jgi:hypothetical protein